VITTGVTQYIQPTVDLTDGVGSTLKEETTFNRNPHRNQSINQSINQSTISFQINHTILHFLKSSQ